MSNLSEYEKKRLENIKANEALLSGFDLPTLSVKKESTGKTLKKHTPRPTPKQPQVATRASARIRGKEPDLTDIDYVEPTYKRAKYENVEINDAMSEEDQKKFLGMLKETIEMPNTKPAVKKHHAPKENKSFESLEKAFGKLEIRHEWATVKVTPARITHCLFHPSSTNILAIATDTEGYIGFWDVNGKEKDDEPVTYKYRPHRRTISDVHFNPTDNTKLLSSSYDGFIRIFDLNTAEFDTLDLGSDQYPITGFDMTQDGHCAWFTTSDGELGFVDTRASGKDVVIHELKNKKVGSVHLNPMHQHLVALSSNDRTSTIWDLRMWNKRNAKVEPLQSIEHGYSVTSSYWSPHGDMLVTTAYDSFIRLFELDKDSKTVELKAAIPHNCKTGR
ncbi:WD repeat-containing protein [Mucor ambiguus]|uniref:DNA damage-binding protein CMR1 n=1 Tax=Mucor ambiguus TaxID=91626 RepID=A0A0C9M8Q5_9FUNG|nr:WD repeat-containing protein [Mucor ambiguus]